MPRAFITGIGITEYGIFRDKSLRALAAEAAMEAMADAAIDKQSVQALFIGNFAATGLNNQNHVGPMVATAIGLPHVPTVHTEAACASGGLALRQAIIAVEAGVYERVLVIGAEKMNTVQTPEVTRVLAQAGDWEMEMSRGMTFPAVFAMMAMRHMQRHGTRREHMAAVAVKNHANGALNPKAHIRKAFSMQQVLDCPVMIASPLTLLDCGLITDGAAAVIVCSEAAARDYAGEPIAVLGHGQASDAFTIMQKADITVSEATIRASQEAYRRAGLKPQDIDLAEVHDCFTIGEIIAIEGLGFVSAGEGGRATLDGRTLIGGELPVNASGGLKAKGHPVGATGVGQAVEIVTHLRGNAGARQVSGARVGLTHNIGGSAASCVVHILGKS